MSKQIYLAELDGQLDLKDPYIAAVLAWLVPGLGHIYQGRTAKGILFFIAILGTFLYGLFALGDGRVVYASWKPQTRRLQYICQVGVGLAALPALVQANRANNHKPLLFGGVMAPPAVEFDPANRDNENINQLHLRLHRYFELGTVYTMIAGLLNVLVIYDAFAGPAYANLPGTGGGSSGTKRKEEEPNEKAPDG